MSNDRTIDLILGRTIKVEVDGHELELSIPNADELNKIRSAQAQLASVTPNEGEAINEEFLNAMMQFNAMAVSACVGCSADQATRLIVGAGGDDSELVVRSQELCGFKISGGGGEQDPN